MATDTTTLIPPPPLAVLDAVGVYEDGLFGFRVGPRALPYAADVPLLAREYDARGRTLADAPDDEAVYEVLRDQVANAARNGAAFEFTGGLDSRLLVTMALDAGVKPDFVFTVGPPDFPDVVNATNLAAQCGLRHIRLEPRVTPDNIWEQTQAIVRGGGYVVNAASFAWLPQTLSPLEGKRTAQVSGLAGGSAGSVYYTPFDPLVEKAGLLNAWMKTRMVRTWLGVDRVWMSKASRDLKAQALSEAREVLLGYDGSWREKTDDFYRDNRVRNWAFPIVRASSTLYDVVAPFLHEDYIEWACRLTPQRKAGRDAQLNLFRFAGQWGVKMCRPNIIQKDHGGYIQRVSTKVTNRLIRKTREAPIGVGEAAEAFVRSPELLECLRSFVGSGVLPIDESGVESLIASPLEHAELLGTLVSAAIAWKDQTAHDRTNVSQRDGL